MKKILNRLCVGLFILAIIAAGLIMIDGRATEGMDFGPGSYYYTDIPDWQDRFY